MSAPLILIQSAVGGDQLQQAFDTALVTAIFHEGCVMLSMTDQQTLTRLCEQYALEEKLGHLRELNAALVFSHHLQATELRACIEKASAVLAF